MTDKQVKYVLAPQNIPSELPKEGVINQGGTDIGAALSEVLHTNEKLDGKVGMIYIDMESEELVVKEYVSVTPKQISYIDMKTDELVVKEYAPITPEQVLDQLSEMRPNVPNEDFSRASNVMKYHAEYQAFKDTKEKLSYPEGMKKISKDKDEELKDLAKLMLVEPKSSTESDSVINKIKNLRDDTTTDNPINKPK